MANEGNDGYWGRIARARITRRRAIAGAGAIAATAGAAAVIGCGGDGGRRSDDQPRTGGTLRTGTALPLSSGLDPHLEAGAGLAIFPRVYGYLLHVDSRDDTVMLDHVERIQQPDARTTVITLRPDVRFQSIAPVNGRVVTAEDVARSIERYRDNQVVTNRTWHTTILDRVEATDATTLRITTKRAYAYTLQAVGDINAGAIIPKELIDSQVSLAFSGVGSGPFSIERASLRDGVKIVRNDGYFGAPLPYLDAMEWSLLAESGERIDAFKRRDIDAMANDDASEAHALREFSADIDVVSQPSLAYLSIGLRTDRPPFNDDRVRGAMDLSLDRAAMVRDLTLGEGQTAGPVNPHLGGGFWSLTGDEIGAAAGAALAPDERRATATAYLAAAGAANASFALQVPRVPQLIDVATFLRDQMQRVGFTVRLEELDLLSWYANLRGGRFEATLISQFPWESPDIPTRFYHSAGPEGTRSPFGYANAGIDGLIERSWGESDRAVRRETLLEAQRLMVRERPLLQLFTSVGYSSAWSYVRGRRADLPGSLSQYDNALWLDRE